MSPGRIIIHNVESGGSILRAAVATLLESVRSPFSTTLIWDQIPIETKSFNPSQEPIRARTRDAALGKAPARVPPLFKMVILIVLALTVAAGISEIVMATIWTHPSDMQKSAYESMATSWKMGFGALIGLLGGKAVR